MDAMTERLDRVVDRLVAIESTLDLLVRQRVVKDWYSTGELAMLLGKDAERSRVGQLPHGEGKAERDGLGC